VVQAYAEGKIELPKPNDRNGKGLRYAPRFAVSKKQINEHNLFPYNAESIARFLGWMSGDQWRF
jgi:hypothetical protein